MTENEAYLDKLADLEATPRLLPPGGSPWGIPRNDVERAEKLTAIARREKQLRAEKDEIRLAIPQAVAAGQTRFHDAVAWICGGLCAPQDNREDRFRAGQVVAEVMLEGAASADGSTENVDGLTRWGAALKEYPANATAEPVRHHVSRRQRAELR